MYIKFEYSRFVYNRGNILVNNSKIKLNIEFELMDSS